MSRHQRWLSLLSSFFISTDFLKVLASMVRSSLPVAVITISITEGKDRWWWGDFSCNPARIVNGHESQS